MGVVLGLEPDLVYISLNAEISLCSELRNFPALCPALHSHAHYTPRMHLYIVIAGSLESQVKTSIGISLTAGACPKQRYLCFMGPEQGTNQLSHDYHYISVISRERNSHSPVSTSPPP
jgi:hypothetical protein